jgi:hypothetical protein
LQLWHRQALDFASGQRADPPYHHLLLSTLPETPLPPTIEGTGDDQFFNVPFNKPKNEGITHRAYDPEAMFIVGIAHVVGGCSWGTGPYGSRHRYYYYERIKFRATRNRRPYLIRVIVGTDSGLLTKENRGDFHDHRRQALGELVKQVDPRDPTARYGREALIEWTVEELLRKAIASGVDLPPDLTEERVRQMFKEGFALLDRRPLGALRAEAAE